MIREYGGGGKLSKDDEIFGKMRKRALKLGELF